MNQTWLREKGARLMSAVLMAACLAVSNMAAAAAAEYGPSDQLDEVFAYIERYHYSGIDEEQLRDAAIDGMLMKLGDPYTEYYNEERWAALNSGLEQDYVGIGVLLEEVDSGLLIRKVYPGSAAEAADLHPGDMLVGIAGEDIRGQSLSDLIDRLLGEEGTNVALDVQPAGGGAAKEVVMTRRAFHIPTVESGRFSGGIGYIQITSFSSDTAASYKAAMDKLKEGPFEGLIVDVRGNPGGYLEAVRGVASNFIEDGTLMYTENRDGDRKEIMIQDGQSADIPVVLLIDEGSASASEVLAGALKDYKLAELIGTRTFGKGSVQSLIPLQTGGGLKLTVEHYFTPNGNEVHGEGINPDRTVADPAAQTITALHEAGAGQIRLLIRPYETEINGRTFDHRLQVIRENTRVFVPSVVLSALVEGQASWDGGTSTVSIRSDEGSFQFGGSNGLLLQNGKSYIALDAFVKAYPNVKASHSKNQVTLESM